MLLAYVVRIIFDTNSWVQTDLAHPSSLSAMGATSMSISLIAVMLTELNYPDLISFAVALSGACVQQIFMFLFIRQCIIHKCWPEPFYNIAIHSCIFPAVSISFNSPFSYALRRYFLCLGYITLLPSVGVQIWRVLKPRNKEEEMVANNPSVCVMQGPFSISLTAWLLSPLTHSSTLGTGEIISHILFAASTFVYILTWCAILQRRKSLLIAWRMSSPQWG